MQLQDMARVSGNHEGQIAALIASSSIIWVWSQHHNSGPRPFSLFPAVNKVIITLRFPFILELTHYESSRSEISVFRITYWFQVTPLCCSWWYIILCLYVCFHHTSLITPEIHALWTTTIITCNSSKIKYVHWINAKSWSLQLNTWDHFRCLPFSILHFLLWW